MSGRLSGRRCLITAAGQGIGRETALMFAREGARVIATDINRSALDAFVEQRDSIEPHVLDVTDSHAVEGCVAEAGEVDVLFNCAGYVHQG
jgi:2-keto-3-deoxy-L-fuconate dehydrogenase